MTGTGINLPPACLFGTLHSDWACLPQTLGTQFGKGSQVVQVSRTERHWRKFYGLLTLQASVKRTSSHGIYEPALRP